MDENQNYGYNDGNFGNQNQGMNDGQQPYANQQTYGPNEQPFVQAPYGQQPAGTAPQFNQTPYAAQQQYNQQNFGQPVKAVVYDAVPDKAHGTSIAALVCGILGLVFFWSPGVDLGLCLAGLICSIVSLAKGLGGKGIAIAGLILSILASILTLIFFYLFVLGMMLL